MFVVGNGSLTFSGCTTGLMPYDKIHCPVPLGSNQDSCHQNYYQALQYKSWAIDISCILTMPILVEYLMLWSQVSHTTLIASKEDVVLWRFTPGLCRHIVPSSWDQRFSISQNPLVSQGTVEVSVFLWFDLPYCC